MRIPIISTIFQKELLDTLRDRRTLIFMIMVPIVAMPLLMMGTMKLMLSQMQKAQAERSKVVVEGVGYLSADLKDALFGSDSLEVIDAATYFSGAEIAGDEVLVHDSLLAEVKTGALDAVVVIPEAFSQAIDYESETDIEIYYDEAEVVSGFALDKLYDIFRPYREQIIESRIVKRELPAEILRPFSISDYSVASQRKLASKVLGGLLPYGIILICFLGAMYPAIDLAAGEKERGTLETLLISPPSRGEFVIGKYSVILLTSLVAALLALASLTLSIPLLFSDLAPDLAEKVLIEVDLETAALALAVLIPLAGIFAAALLSVSIFAKSFKEAQSYITGLNMFIIVPAFVSFLPGIKMNLPLALIPVVNVSVIIKEAIAGTIVWNYVAVAFVSTLLLAALALVFAKRLFEKESVLFRN